MAAAKEKTIIDQLPGEMLLKVFAKLETEEMKNAALVCKRWNEVIGQNSVTMKQLPLSLEGSWLRTYQQISNFERRYHTVVIENAGEWTENAVNVFSKHGSDMRCLELTDCSLEIRQAELFNRLFKLCKKMETLKLNNVDLDVYEASELNAMKSLDLPCLKRVVLNESSLAILEFIKTSQLISLKVNADSSNLTESYFVDYLAGQTMLEELAIRDLDLSDSDINYDSIKAIKFPLKKLAMTRMHGLPKEDDMLAFLGKFVDTLEVLEIGGTFPDAVFEMIFKKFRKLKCLTININQVPKDDAFYHNLRPNTSVKKLVIQHFKQDHVKSVEGIIGNLPNIDTLVFENDNVPSELMVFISNNLLGLKHLYLQKINSKLIKNVRIASLTSLNIQCLYKIRVNDWKKIVIAFPNIEKLSIKQTSRSSSITDFEFNIITKGLTNLSHVQLGDGFVAIKRIFNQLLRNCPKMKTVEISEDAFSLPKAKNVKNGILRDFKKDGLRFIIHSEEEMLKIFDEHHCSLWKNEDAADDFDDDYNSDGSDVRLMAVLFNAIGGDNPFAFDSDDEDHSENDFIYFDSDGEMRHWDEDPSDYGYFDDFYLD